MEKTRVRQRVFCTVGTEMLTSGSVGAGWDQLERTGPKETRQVTLGSERRSKTNMESQHCEDEKPRHEEMVADFLVR